MRIIHSSDWHLGLSLGALALGEEHDLFLDWLFGVLDAHAVDALVIAGDVFDTANPSADAMRRYYGFLARIAGTGVRQVIIVGGNHDGASRLEAPADVLRALAVHVVGGIDGVDDALARCVIPLWRRGAAADHPPAAVCLAVPYVHEFRLGVRTTEPERSAMQSSMMSAFTGLYARLCDRAAELFPGVPIVATGHLTLGGASAADYPEGIHQVGMIDALPDTVVDSRIQYLALGHIHRSYPRAGGRAWYSGTPVATSFTEGAARQVLRVDLAPGAPAVVSPIEVPRARALVQLDGTVDEVCAHLRALRWSERLPPALKLTVRVDGAVGNEGERIEEALSACGELRPVVALREFKAPAPADGAELAIPLPESLAAMSAEDVLRDLCARRGVADVDSLVEVFALATSLAEIENDDARRGIVERFLEVVS